MPIIGSRTFGDGVKKYITLGSEELIRPIGGRWNQLSIGILCALTPNGTSNIPLTKLAIGVCSGTTNGVGYANGTGPTTNFVGRWLVSNVLTYNANSGNPYYSQPIWVPGTRVNTTENTSGTGTTNVCIATNTGTIQRRSLLTLKLTKSSTNMIIGGTCNDTTQMATNWTYTDLLDSVMTTTGSPIRGNTMIVMNNMTLAGGDANGILDSVNIWWPSALYPLEIYAIEVVRWW